MENFRFIEYHHTRDFSRKLNATFEYIKQNFKSLAKSILFIAGPPVLVASLLLGSFMGDMMGFSRASSLNPGADAEMVRTYFMSATFWLQICLMLIFLLVSSVMTVATINNYIILYEEKKTNKIEVQEVWERVRATFWMYLGTMFLFALMGTIVYVILLIPIFLLAAISEVLIFFGGVILFVGLFYLIISLSLVFFIRGYEKLDFMEAVARSFKLVQGKWWSTFGLLMILYMIMGFASYIFIMPMYIITFVSTLHSLQTGVAEEPSTAMQIITTVSFTLYYLAQMVLNTLPNVGIAFQYFNLVERKESKGLMSQIEQIGQEPQRPTSAADEHY